MWLEVGNSINLYMILKFIVSTTLGRVFDRFREEKKTNLEVAVY